MPGIEGTTGVSRASSPLDQLRYRGTAANVPVPHTQDLGELGDWVRGRFQAAGLDPTGALDDARWVRAPGMQAEAIADQFGPGRGLVRIGTPFVRSATGDDAAAAMARTRLANVAAHEGAHLVHAALSGVPGGLGESGAVREHVADVLARLATGVEFDRHSSAPLYDWYGAERLPHHVYEYVTTDLDGGGRHVNSTILTRAARKMLAPGGLSGAEAGAIYVDAMRTPGTTIASFADDAVRSAEQLFSPASKQAELVRHSFNAVGLVDRIRESRGLLADVVPNLARIAPRI